MFEAHEAAIEHQDCFTIGGPTDRARAGAGEVLHGKLPQFPAKCVIREAVDLLVVAPLEEVFYCRNHICVRSRR
jgi:hypothetical protein